MRKWMLKGLLLIVASTAMSVIMSGDAVSAARRQSAVVWLKEPTLIVSTIIQGPVMFTHDDDKMARGEPCTTVHLWEPGKGRGEDVASFHCTPTARKPVGKFTFRTEPNVELGFGCILKEYQFAGDSEGHGVPSSPTLVKWGGAKTNSPDVPALLPY
jgi:hypothetical protein